MTCTPSKGKDTTDIAELLQEVSAARILAGLEAATENAELRKFCYLLAQDEWLEVHPVEFIHAEPRLTYWHVTQWAGGCDPAETAVLVSRYLAEELIASAKKEAARIGAER